MRRWDAVAMLPRPLAAGLIGMIVAVGGDAAVLRFAGRDTRRIDLRGHTVLPGFVDAHDHLFNDAESHGLTLSQAQGLALEHGITALGDMFVPPEFLRRMRTFASAGLLRVRIEPVPDLQRQLRQCCQPYCSAGAGPLCPA
jgi:hypothetical protein